MRRAVDTKLLAAKGEILNAAFSQKDIDLLGVYTVYIIFIIMYNCEDRIS